MPETQGQYPGRSDAGRSASNMRRAQYAGALGIPPGSAPYDCVPETALARAVVSVIKDPCARVHMALLIEEALRNFQTPVSLPPWLEPPIQSLIGPGRVIDAAGGNGAVAAAAAWDDLNAALTGDVPRGFMLVLRRFGQGVSAADAWDDVRWRIVRRGLGAAAGVADEVGIEPYQEIVHQIGEVDVMTDIYAAMEGPLSWAVQCKNNSGTTAYGVYARVVGWTFPIRAGEGTPGAAVV